jgi:hypothetical protein
MAYNETPTKGITMQHTYSLYGSPLHLILEEKVADGYNRVHLGFIEAYDDIAKLLNLLIEINGGSLDINEDQCITATLDRV